MIISKILLRESAYPALLRSFSVFRNTSFNPIAKAITVGLLSGL